MDEFKKMVQSDLDMIFSVDMFAEEHIINGKKMVVIIDNDKLADLKAKSQYADGIATAEMLILIKSAEFGLKPAPMQIVSFDDDIYRVVTVLSSDGLFEIALEANG